MALRGHGTSSVAGLKEIEIELPGMLSAMRNYMVLRSETDDVNSGLNGSLDFRVIERKIVQMESKHYNYVRVFVVISIPIVLWAYCWFVVDVNSTSIHALYRDRLASTFLIGIDNKGDIGIENDIDLEEICSAAAASPNMGRSTSPSLVAFMTMLNIRLGVWIPHPGRVEDQMHKFQWRREEPEITDQGEKYGEASIRFQTSSFGFTFEDVFEEEVKEIEERWTQAYSDPAERDYLVSQSGPAVERTFVGLALSRGGIRSATINL